MFPKELHKTISPSDLQEPAAKQASRALRGFLLRARLRGLPVAVNGVLKKRWYLRKHKMWEYARGVAYSEPKPEHAVLDFGGGGTLPVFFLAARGSTVKCLDVNETLVDHTNSVAERQGWALEASPRNITHESFPESWGRFDRVYSFCVIEHLPKAEQQRTMALLANRLKPGGRLVITFDFGLDAPEGGAIRDVEEVEGLISASGLGLMGGGGFRDTGERFALNKRYKDRRFTFGSLFLEK